MNHPSFPKKETTAGRFAELKPGVPVLHISDSHKAEIVNYLGIQEYNDHTIRIRTKNHVIEITGAALQITFLQKEHMLVEGRILQIRFLFESK